MEADEESETEMNWRENLDKEIAGFQADMEKLEAEYNKRISESWLYKLLERRPKRGRRKKRNG